MALAPLPSRASILVLGFVLAAGASAMAGGCGSGGGDTTTTGTGGSGTTSTPGGGGAGGTGGTGTTSSTGGTGGMMSCDQCLASQCSAEIAACDSECVAIQACLDSVCAHLSMTGSPDEGTCQVHCQSLHTAAKSKHLAVVNCVIGAGCQPPCAGYSFDWDQCVAAQSKGTCKAALDACNNDTNCSAYQACAATCGSYNDCTACAGTPEGKMGEQLYETYWQCVEKTCLPDGWLPSF